MKDTDVAPRQIWQHTDGLISKRFRIVSIVPIDNTMRVYGTYLGSGKGIGSNWTVRKLATGYRRATLIEEAPDTPLYVAPKRHAPAAREKDRSTRLVYPMGEAIPKIHGRVRELAARLAPKLGPGKALVRCISERFGYSALLVEAILAGTAPTSRASPGSRWMREAAERERTSQGGA